MKAAVQRFCRASFFLSIVKSSSATRAMACSVAAVAASAVVLLIVFNILRLGLA